jgi:hypothetical protein
MITKSFFTRVGAPDPAYVNAFFRLGCAGGKSIRLTFLRERIPGSLGAGLGPLHFTVNGLRVDLPYGLAAVGGRWETRSIVLPAADFDSVDDKGVIEFSGFDPATNDPSQNHIALNMNGFAVAYAKLHEACAAATTVSPGCVAGDISPQCTLDAPKAQQTAPSTSPAPEGLNRPQ